MTKTQKILGIDIGGSSIKMGNVIDQNVTDYVTFELPVPNVPNNVFAYIRSYMPVDVSETIGIALPGVVVNDLMKTASNIDISWLTTNTKQLAEDMLERRCVFINDCDSAGLAEIKYGVAKDIKGTVIVVTLGTGIGTALFHNGILFPNTELGHLSVYDISPDIEKYCSAKVKQNLRLEYIEYVDRLNIYLNELYRLLHPNAIVIGGGISEEFEKWGHLIKVPCDIYKAELGNNAGIIGAALYARECKI